MSNYSFEDIYNAAEDTFNTEYAQGEYTHKQSFLWGFQEGVDWLLKNKI